MPFRYIASTRFAHMQATVTAGETLAEQHAAGQGPIQPKGPTKESDPSKTSHSTREISQVAKAKAKEGYRLPDVAKASRNAPRYAKPEEADGRQERLAAKRLSCVGQKTVAA